MGVLLVGGFAFVLAAIVYQASRAQRRAVGRRRSRPAWKPSLPIPKDATINSLALDGDRLALHLNSASGPEIVVLDLKSRKWISRVGSRRNRT